MIIIIIMATNIWVLTMRRAPFTCIKSRSAHSVTIKVLTLQSEETERLSNLLEGVQIGIWLWVCREFFPVIHLFTFICIICIYMWIYTSSTYWLFCFLLSLCLTFFVVVVSWLGFYFLFIYFLFIYLYFIFGCVGSSSLRAGFVSLRRAGATLRCRAQASRCGGFSCCGAQALGARASVVVARGLSNCGSQA